MSASYDDAEPPSKRRRDDSESSQEEIVKHETLYFENGNIVILSLPKDNTVTAFKVFKDYLLLQSAVFEGMLSIPSPPDMEMYDNVPLVRLQDEAADLVPFLNAVYDPMAIPSKSDFYTSVDKVRSVFKLSKKYQVDKLLTCVTDKLLKIWPVSLPAWDSVLGEEREPAGLFDEVLDHIPLPEPCYTICLAHDHGIPEILPTAFYHLFRSLPNAFSKTRPEDGEHWGLGNPEARIRAEANFDRLSRDQFMCFVRGSYAIRESLLNNRKSIMEIVSEDPESCCMADVATCVRNLEPFSWRHVDAMCRNGDPIHFLRGQSILKGLHGLEGVCHECSSLYVAAMEEYRNELWEKLPEFFGVEMNVG